MYGVLSNGRRNFEGDDASNDGTKHKKDGETKEEVYVPTKGETRTRSQDERERKENEESS